MSNKFKEAVIKTKKIYGEAFEKYPVTMIVDIVVTLIACAYLIYDSNVSYSNRGSAYYILKWLIEYGIYFGVGCLGIEAFSKGFYQKHKTIKKAVGFIVVAGLSFFFCTMSWESLFGIIDIEDKLVNGPNDMQMLCMAYAYFLLIMLCIVYCRYKESGYSIQKYFVSVLADVIALLIVWGVIALGLLLLAAAFCELIVDTDALYTVPQVLAIGAYVMPCIIMALTKIKDEVGKFFAMLIKYVMLIITIAGAVIIYLYIIKLLFFNGIPSNEVFSITTVLFFVAIPVGFACTAFEKDTLLQKIAYILPYIYAPFIILQCYSDIVRIAEYGITPSRYMGMVLIVLEVCYTVVYAFARKHIDKLLLLMMAITVIVTIVPVTNVWDASRISQERAVDKYIENGMPSSQEEQKRVCGAYKFLLDNYGEGYVDELLTREQQETISAMGALAGEYVFRDFSTQYTLSSNNSFLPTDGFDIIAGFDTYPDNSSGEVDAANVIIEIDGTEFGPFDFTNEIANVREKCRNEDNSCYGEDIMKVSDDCELIITYLRVLYDDERGTIKELRISGHMLYKLSYFDKNPTSAVGVD